MRPIAVDAALLLKVWHNVDILSYVTMLNPYCTICVYMCSKKIPNVLEPGFVVYILINDEHMTPNNGQCASHFNCNLHHFPTIDACT